MEQYIENLLSQLTLEEKVSMIHGSGLFCTAAVERLNIPPLWFSDGPMGVRAEFANDQWKEIADTGDLVTYLPCNSAVASTWNRDLAFSAGSVLGEEARGRGKDMILAPGINIKRSPLCGRNFEYMSEDPYLIGQIAAPMIRGIQQHDVSACVKHFAANSQETDRLWVDTRVDEKTLHEIYLPGFRAAVHEGGAWGLMGAYNQLDGQHCCTSKPLLDGILRDKWGYDGVVVSDWGGVHDTVKAANSSLDVEMDVIGEFGKHYLADALLEKIRSGEISERCVDDKVRNILRLMLRLKMIGPEKDCRKPGAYNTKSHQESALAVAQESIILLKNDANKLPLNKETVKTVALIGGNAITMHAAGGGSAEIKALYEITPLLGIKKFLGGSSKVCYAPGYGQPKLGARPEINWQAASTQGENYIKPSEPVLDENLVSEAVDLAKRCDTVIFVGGLNHDYDVEGLDRASMKLPYDQDKVLEAVLDVRPDTVVVMYAGSPVEMPWLDRVQTLVWSYYAGMEGGTALANVLFGAAEPSGRLAETMPKSLADCPAKQGVNFALREKVVYDEGTQVGYRYYDANDVPVNFCFGHGLGYTAFAYSNLQTAGDRVSLTVTNTGSRPGKETVQLYVAAKGVHRLRNFEKLALLPGESKCVEFTLTDMDFSEYDTETGDFAVVPGVYEIQLGASSRDIRLCAHITKEASV